MLWKRESRKKISRIYWRFAILMIKMRKKKENPIPNSIQTTTIQALINSITKIKTMTKFSQMNPSLNWLSLNQLMKRNSLKEIPKSILTSTLTRMKMNVKYEKKVESSVR